MDLLVFTDLDGSLLDHEDYSFAGALPALQELRRRGVPLIAVTSKTRSEVEPLQRALGIDDPFVVENGGGIYLPPAYADLAPDGELAGRYRRLSLGVPYAEIRRFVEAEGHALGVTGFGDLGVDEVARLTGLAPEEAERACRRDFTEPFLLADEARLGELTERAAVHQLAVTRGGRFFHLLSRRQDKGEAVRRLVERFRRRGREVVSLGLGDSPNDLPMLHAVDLAVVIPNPARGRLDPGRDDALLAPSPGSRGWNAAVLETLERQRRAGIALSSA